MNKVYEKAYEIHKKLSWWIGPDPYGLNWFMTGHLNNKFDGRFQADLVGLHKELFPRRKKINTLNVPEDAVKELQVKYLAIATKYVSVKQRQYELLTQWLNDHAKDVELVAEWQITYHSEYYTYGSQTSPETYTGGNCKRKAMLLDKHSIPYEIKTYWLNENYEMTLDPTGKVAYAYHKYNNEDWSKQPKGTCLYAPLTPYMLDALERRSNETLLEWAANCWKSGINPKVLSPFLPDEIYDKSLELWRTA